MLNRIGQAKTVQSYFPVMAAASYTTASPPSVMNDPAKPAPDKIAVVAKTMEQINALANQLTEMTVQQRENWKTIAGKQAKEGKPIYVPKGSTVPWKTVALVAGAIGVGALIWWWSKRR